MTFSQAVFLSLLYQDRPLYTADYWTPEAISILLVLAALAVILIVAFFWWTRRRKRARGTK
jgi:LPXTG-motif cell wall-anchored protein